MSGPRKIRDLERKNQGLPDSVLDHRRIQILKGEGSPK
jgi:hypothetical protein